MKRQILLIIISFFSIAIFAEEKEAGSYDRKSISYVNRILLLDNSVKNQMPPPYTHITLKGLKKTLLLERFDRNPLTEDFLTEFTAEIDRTLPNMSGNGGKVMDSISAVMNRTIVPKIVSIVEASKKVRAELLLTEQQKNSFITDKAKEVGVTADELNRVMNSAYLFLPFVRNYSDRSNKKEGTYSVSLDIGVMIWKISVAGDSAKAIPLMRKVMTGTGSSRINGSYLYKGSSVGYREYAFRQLLNEVNMNLEVAVKEVEAFKLRSQITEDHGLTVKFDLGKKAGIRVNDKFFIMRNIEMPDGSIVQKKGGWVRVTKVGTREKTETSKAAIVGGRPSIGSEIKEYPRIPMDFTLKGRNYKLDIENSKTYSHINVKTRDAWGPELQISTDIGRYVRVPQLYLGVEAGFGFGGYYGTVKNNSTVENNSTVIEKDGNYYMISYDVSITKKFFFRRVGLVLDPAFGGQYLVFSGADIKTYSDTLQTEWVNNTIGFIPRGGVEVAIMPFLNVGAIFGYQFFIENNIWFYKEKDKTDDKAKWEDKNLGSIDPMVNSDGFIMHFYVTASFPRLPGNLFNKNKK